MGTATIDVTLAAGANTIRFTKGTNNAELDSISIPRYEAENNSVNHAAVFTNGNSSNGQVVGTIDYADSFVRFNTVRVATAGTYTLRVRYSNGLSNATYDVAVNGGTASSLGVPATGSFQTFSSVTMTVTLVAGNNIIQVGYGTQHAELDYIEVYK